MTARTAAGRRAVHDAAARNHAERLAELAAAGADLDKRDDKGAAPLHAAAAEGSAQAILFLLNTGAPATSHTLTGDTALHRLASGRCSSAGAFSSCASLLVTAGVAVDSRNLRGRTPLMDAVKSGREHRVATLLALGADPGATDAGGKTVLRELERLDPSAGPAVRTRLLDLLTQALASRAAREALACSLGEMLKSSTPAPPTPRD